MSYVLTDRDDKELKTLLASNEGVVARTSGLTMGSSARVLVVGLGGVGAKTVADLKAKLRERVGQIQPDRIQFLAIDTDKDTYNNIVESGKLSIAEFPVLNNTVISQILAMPKDTRPEYINKVISSDFNPTVNSMDGTGANQVRLLGRLSLISDPLYSNVREVIRRAISTLRDFVNNRLDIHVVAGIGGGTGSGMIIDVPYIIRSVASQMAINNMKLFGHVYLPNIYKNSQTNLDQAYKNGYAALKEIDYYMSINKIDEKFDADYPDGRFSSASPIFDQCTIIGGELPDLAITDNKERAINVCIDNLINQVTQVTSKHQNVLSMANQAISDVFTSNSFMTNAQTALSQVITASQTNHFDPAGNYNFNMIGYAALTFPAEDKANEFLSNIYSKAIASSRANANAIAQKDVDEFEKSLIKPVDFIDKAADSFDGKIDEILNETRWDRKTRMTNIADSSLETALKNALTEFNRTGEIFNDAMAAANAKAGKIFQDIQKGPFYLEKLLTSQAEDAGKVNGFFEKLGGYAEALVKYRNRLDADIASCKEERQKVAASHALKATNVYKDLTKSYYVLKFKKELGDKLTSEYAMLSNQLGAPYRMKCMLEDNYLRKVDYLNKLGEILEFNANPRPHAPGDMSVDDLTDPIFTALRATLANAVQNAMAQLTPERITAFSQRLFSEIETRSKEWFKDFPGEFRSFVKNYNDSVFTGIMGRSFLGYLDEAYNGQPVSVKENVVNKLKEAIDTHSRIMCTPWLGGNWNWNWVQNLKYSFMILPQSFYGNANDPNSWGNVFKSQFITDNKTSIFASPDENAVYYYNLYAKFPLWVNKDIKDYEERYNALRDGLEHINANEDFEPGYDKYPPLFIQSQWFRARQGNQEYINQSEVEYRQYLKDLLSYAEKHDILVSNGNRCVILETTYPDEKKIKGFIDNYIKNPNNYEPKGALKVQGVLAPAANEAFGYKEHPIYGAEPGNEESILNNLRKQMKLIGVLEKVIEDYKAIVFKPVYEVQTRILSIRRTKDVAKWIFYGLIDERNGVWFYKLGDSETPITTRARERNSGNWEASYMEMAVKDAFFKMDGQVNIAARLDERCNHLADLIYKKPDTYKSAVVESYEKYKAIAKKHLDEFVVIENRGNDLDQNQTKAQEFYKIFTEELNNHMESYQ